jgi:hypothetical protein
MKIARIAMPRRAPVGTTFRFTVSEAALVSFAFTKAVAGRRVRGRCVAALRKQAIKRPCSRTVTAGRFGFFARHGANRVRFDGRISASKMLKLGGYSLVISAVNPVGRTTARLRFTIVG